MARLTMWGCIEVVAEFIMSEMYVVGSPSLCKNLGT